MYLVHGNGEEWRRTHTFFATKKKMIRLPLSGCECVCVQCYTKPRCTKGTKVMSNRTYIIWLMYWNIIAADFVNVHSLCLYGNMRFKLSIFCGRPLFIDSMRKKKWNLAPWFRVDRRESSFVEITLWQVECRGERIAISLAQICFFVPKINHGISMGYKKTVRATVELNSMGMGYAICTVGMKKIEQKRNKYDFRTRCFLSVPICGGIIYNFLDTFTRTAECWHI